MAAVKSEHLDAGFTDPTQPRNVRLAAEGASRIAAEKRGWPRERLPFPVEALLAHVNSVRFLSDVGLRDAALVAVGVRLMLRPGELAKMMIGDIQVRGEDIRVRLGKTKADQKSERRPLPLERVLSSPACPVKLLKAWMLRRRAQGAPDSARLFLGAAGRALTSSAISSIVRRMVEAHGLDPKAFAGHSLMIGGASAALAGGLSVDQVMAVGGWKSDAVKQYLAPVLRKQQSVAKKMGF